MNTHGQLFRLTTFGESHGPAIGVVIDGLPAGFEIDRDNVRHQLDRRKTGQSSLTSARKEQDHNFDILSGIFAGQSTGHPIMVLIHNTDARSKDYSTLKDVFRPNHADLTYHLKYGIRDHRGGGRSSARETASRVIAGAIAQQYLREHVGIDFYAYVKQVGDISIENDNIDLDYIDQNDLRTADPHAYPAMSSLIQDIAADGDSIGGIIECIITNPPSGLGEPVFDKLKARLAQSMLSIGGVLGFEYGAGFDGATWRGSAYNESFISTANPQTKTKNTISSHSNRYGGILGGISTGEDIIFRLALKPTSSINKEQHTVDTSGKKRTIQISGRHDPCLLPRAVPIVEAMAAIDILDLYLIDRARSS